MSTMAARGLTLGYHGQPVVTGLDLEVSSGEIVALLGANGAGKTTTLLGLSGLVAPMDGDVMLDGASLTTVAPFERARRGLAHVPEDRALFADLTVKENLQLGRRSRRKPVDGALDLCPELRPLLDRRAGLLSGGEQQMLAVARALAESPNILLVDEMSLGLAPLIVERLLRLLADLVREGACGVLLVEQHVHQALTIAGRGYVLDRGTIVLEGPSAVLLEQPDLLESSYFGEPTGEATGEV